MILLAVGGPSGRAADFNGRYVAAVRATDAPAAAAETYGGTVDVAVKRKGYAITWQPADGTRRRRGLGLRDGDALGVSVATGGAAYGVAVYRRTDEGREWRGPWITSIDGAGGVGEIAFRTAARGGGPGGPLPGRHPLTCHRPGAGSFEGAVDITARGDEYLLTFYLGGRLLYRGLGALVAEDRLVVAWSFGSPPALAVYRVGGDGLLTGRRASWRGGAGTAAGERLAHEGDEATRLLPGLANARDGGDGGADGGDLPAPAFGAQSEAEGALLAMMEPGAPSVKTWDYDELQSRYGAEGWADRWLAEQLAPDDLRLLRAAVKRRERARIRARDKGQTAPPADEKRTVADLIAAERQRTTADED